jgi:hypothetical protein
MNHDDLGGDLRLNFRALADGQRALAVDFALDATVDTRRALKVELATDAASLYRKPTKPAVVAAGGGASTLGVILGSVAVATGVGSSGAFTASATGSSSTSKPFFPPALLSNQAIGSSPPVSGQSSVYHSRISLSKRRAKTVFTPWCVAKIRAERAKIAFWSKSKFAANPAKLALVLDG